jgi:HSP20 family protein
MLFGSLYSRDVLAELDRLQREVQQSFEISPSIRGLGRGGFPALNVGGAPQSVEIYAFAPGVDPQSVEVNLDRGVLTIAGERKPDLPEGEKVTTHINERFHGQFRRVLTLPDDVDPNAVDARYRDGVLHISIKRREEAQPRRIAVH